ncbi:hypothetical protein [uncultured Pontibacter sp.]|uniref:hypothetical protein n=1 Tax=uncultured Pontibacter sp. TaxID=453356 RepID=UPI002622B144|nr:hypothetical protein [uncultured Pontibacter sp.]
MAKTVEVYTSRFILPEETIQLLKTDKLSVKYLKQEETLEICWEGDVTSDEFKYGYTQIIEHVKAFKPVKWQLNVQNRQSLRRADQRWVFEYVFPEVLKIVNDDVFVAVVVPVSSIYNLVGELDGDELMTGENFLIMQHFMYPEEAQRWLNEMCLIKYGVN